MKSIFARSIPVFTWLIALCGWNFAVERSLSLSTLTILVSIALGTVLLGYCLCQILFDRAGQLQMMTNYLLVGILLGNVLLFVLAFITPWGIVTNWMLILGLVSLIALQRRGKAIYQLFLVRDATEGILLVGALLVSTLWCADVLQPIAWTDDAMQMRVWGDVFYHMSEINVFARVNAISEASDILMGGMPFRPYHYASYLWPALITRASGLSSYIAFSSFMLPAGLLTISLSAFVLCAPIFGRPAALIAGLLTLLLPDPSQQGFGNLFLGPFHWSIQALPAMPYGLACSALAFASLFAAFEKQQWRYVLSAYVFVIATLLYKAHLFVAISYPALVLPALFMGSFSARKRFAAVFLLTLMYALVIMLANTVPAMPTMRLDGSGFIPYTTWLNEIQQPGILKDWLNSGWVKSHRIAKVFSYFIFVLITTIGFVGLLYAGVIWKLRHKMPAYISLFPIIVLCIYLVMALGLALNTGGVGLGEELVQRPFIWAYYVVIVWSIAALYYLWWGTEFPKSKFTTCLLVGAVGMLFSIPFTYSKDIQGHTGSASLEIPLCLYQTAQTLNQKSGVGAIFQESGGDDSFALMALSNRQGFVVDFHGSRLPIVAQKRIAELKIIQEGKNPADLIAYMRANGIEYFINTKEEPFAIALNGDLSPIYQCGSYTLYHLR